MSQRVIAVVTGSRAEYGLLYWLMRGVQADPRLRLQVIVTGMHLSAEFGLTVTQIERDGFSIDEVVESQMSSDSRVGMAKSLGIGVIGMADALRRLRPEVLVVLGDRYEILAAAQTAALLGIPVAHLYGGEVTTGAVDDWMRHCITKASWWHFVAADAYRKRVIQLGEAPERVFNVGAPGLDAIKHLTPLSREELESRLQMRLAAPLFLVTYHPATLGAIAPAEAFRRLLEALDRFPQATIVLTKPNADAGGRELAAAAERWAEGRERTGCFASLGQRGYLSVMRLAEAVIGNSSSGIVEAPALKVPTVNIGPRQDGRLKATSIVDCAEDVDAVTAAINKVLSPQLRRELATTQSLYGDCDASKRIVDLLATAQLPVSLAKRFHDL